MNINCKRLPIKSNQSGPICDETVFFRRVYHFLASFLTTGMRFLLNQKVCLSHLSVGSVSLSVTHVLSLSLPDLFISRTSLSNRSVQLWIMQLWLTWTQYWRQSLWGQRLMNTLVLIILWLMILWWHPRALTWTSGSDSIPLNVIFSHIVWK